MNPLRFDSDSIQFQSSVRKFSTPAPFASSGAADLAAYAHAAGPSHVMWKDVGPVLFLSASEARSVAMSPGFFYRKP